MRSADCVDRVCPTDRPSVIVTCVHGTWARGSRWPSLEASVGKALSDSGPITFQYFEWSGRNCVKARARAATLLRNQLLDQMARTPQARHVLVAHSHGANVVLHALQGAAGLTTPALRGIVMLSPPLLHCQLIDQPVGAANKLLLAAVAAIPLVLMASRYAREVLDASRITQLVAVLAMTAAWLMLFRPAVVRRRADALAQQVALPRLDFPGLIVRASRDEATLALSSVSAFAQLARHVWSRVLEAGTPVWRRDEQQLRDARGFPDLAKAVFDVLILVPMSLALLGTAHEAATNEQWVTLSLSLPFALTLGTAALVLVGGSIVMLLMLPAFSFLLWPFGISPTTAAALLNVTVEDAPTPAWRVVSIQRRDDLLRRSGQVGRWRHSLHKQPEALHCIGVYLRDALAGSPKP
jgi:hypothetical protein